MTGVVACSKELAVQPQTDDLVKVTIIAGNPETESATRTEMDGVKPYWSVGDAIGVSDGTSSNYKFTTAITARAATASFTGTTAVSSALYAYYPYTANGVNAQGAMVDIPSTQKPAVSSFDGSADVMVAKQFSVDSESTTVENLEFKRLGAIIKLVLKDTDLIMGGGQHPDIVSVTAESNLAGRVYVDMVNQKLGDLFENESKTVVADYTSSAKYEIDGSNATYFIVCPQTIEAGTTLTVSASTEGYAIEKIITVPDGGITLEAGKITTINVSLSSDHVTAEDAGASLPFIDDMSWADNGESDSTSDFSSSVSTTSGGLYTEAGKVYKGIGGLKMGSSNATGYITTKELNLTGEFYIAVEGENYNKDTGNLVITIDDAEVLNEAFEDVNYVNIDAGTFSSKSKVTISTSTKRCRLYSVIIKSGTYDAPAQMVYGIKSSGVTSSSATLTASFDEIETSPAPQAAGFYIGASKSDLSTVVYTEDLPSSPSGSFYAEVSSLSAETTYYYQAFMTVFDSQKGAYVDIVSSETGEFTTLSDSASTITGWLELPSITGTEDYVGKFYGSGGEVGTNRNYSYNYSYSWYGCLWVAYPLAPEHTSGSASTSSWSYNPNIGSSYQVDVASKSYTTNYDNSTYSRGHQIPNADRKSDDTMNLQTYYVTNQTPQIQNKFNGTIWSSLEQAVRSEVTSFADTVYVATGACYRKAGGSETVSYLTAASTSINPQSLPIPNYYWKALLKVKRSGDTVVNATAIGFWFDHKGYDDNKYANYAVSVDEIEEYTGFDLFTNLPSALQTSAEANTSWSAFQDF